MLLKQNGTIERVRKTMKNEHILALIDNYNSKLSTNVNKIFTDKTQFMNMLKTLPQYKNISDDGMAVVMSSIDGKYFVNENVFGLRGLTTIRCLSHILWRVDRSLVEKIIKEYDREYISYKDFIKKEKENDETDDETIKRIWSKYPNLFISEIWFYKYIDGTPIVKGPIDIFMQYIKE